MASTMENAQAQADKAADRMRELPTRARETLDEGRVRMNRMMNEMSDAARHYARQADDSVRANPWTALGIGVGVGAIVGILLTLAARSGSERHH